MLKPGWWYVKRNFIKSRKPFSFTRKPSFLDFCFQLKGVACINPNLTPETILKTELKRIFKEDIWSHQRATNTSGLVEPRSQRKDKNIEVSLTLSLSLLLLRYLPICKRFKQEAEKEAALRAFHILRALGYRQSDFSLAKVARTWRVKTRERRGAQKCEWLIDWDAILLRVFLYLPTVQAER